MSEFKELGRLLSNVLISNGIETKAQLVEIMSNNPADIIKLPGVGKMSLAKISNWISGDPIKSMQAEIERLKARLERQAVDWKSIIDENKIKAQGIEEMAEAIKINDASELDDPYCGGTGYDQALAAATAYADNLRAKEGE